jgi:protein-tyrosine phosphatase
MIDLHCHILPEVDDGAKSMEEAVEMARIACEEGIHVIINTSHFIGDVPTLTREELQFKKEQLNRRLKREKIPLKIVLGNEVYISPELPQMVKNHRVCTLGDSRYLLVELPFYDIPLYTGEVLYQLRLQGIIPIIAHPERYQKVVEEPAHVYDWIAQGALIQINAGSLMGRFGPEAKETCQRLLQHRQVHFIGSDGHSPRSRKPRLREAVAIASQIIGNQEADKLVKDHAIAVLQNQKIVIADPLPLVRKKKKERKILTFFKNLWKIKEQNRFKVHQR